MLLLATTLITSRAHAASDETPDAQMLLDLDILTQPEAHDRDFMRKLSLFERLRLLEMFRMLDDAPAAASRRPPATPGTPAAPGATPAMPSVPATPATPAMPGVPATPGTSATSGTLPVPPPPPGTPPPPPPVTTAPAPPAGKER